MSTVKRVAVWGAPLAALALIAGWRWSNRPMLIEGGCQDVFGAPVCVWAKASGDAVSQFGVTVPVRVIENAPAEGEMLWPPPTAAIIPLPPAVKRAAGFDNFQMSWEHHGHPPEAFLKPHFDFHFYTLPVEDVKAIDCSDHTKPARLPPGFALMDLTIPELGTLVGLCVPTMGMHAMTEGELSGAVPFQRAMVLGYYRGTPTFLEPMITRAALLERKPFDLPVPAVADLPAGVRLPASFRADYDARAGEYRFVFKVS